MAITVKHKFVSAIPDAGDPTIVQPSNWNDTHDLVGAVPIANGGTNATTAPQALTNLGAYPASNPAGYTDGDATSIGHYPIVLSPSLQNYDTLMFISNQWVNINQLEISDGGNY